MSLKLLDQSEAEELLLRCMMQHVDADQATEQVVRIAFHIL
ncbi:MAG TPA: hypothetical protein VGA56_19375 [Opitutaceae bacterium]